MKAERDQRAESNYERGRGTYHSTGNRKVANAIEAALPRAVQGVNQNVDTLQGAYCEIDIIVNNGNLVQVKSGPAGGLIKQIEDTIEYTGQRVLGSSSPIP